MPRYSRQEVIYQPIGDPFEKPTSCLHASRAWYRFVVLFFNCLLTFGPYFCFDLPSALNKNFVLPQNNCTVGHGNCTEGLGLSETDYNLLFSVYAWMNAATVLASGFFLDKLGNRIGVMVFSGMCLIGSSTFAEALFLKRRKGGMFALLLIGRLLFGAGNGSLTIVQNRISAFWFEGKELAFAFGCTLAFSRLGSVLNFLLSESFNTRFGLTWTLWGGAILCAGSFVAAMVVCFLDAHGVKQMGITDHLKSQSRQVRISDVRYFRAQYWLLVFTTMFFYNGIFPFVSNASYFIQENYHYDRDHANYVVAAVYAVSMVISPVMGIVVDYFGMRGILSLVCGLLTIPIFGIFSFALSVPPLVGTIWLGVTYSVAAATLWPSVPLVIDHATLGTALGIMTSIQMIGIGICNEIIGVILQYSRAQRKWNYMVLFLLANSLACVALSILLNVLDWRRGGILNRTKKRKVSKRMVHPKRTAKIATSDTDDYTGTQALLYNDHHENHHGDSVNH